MLEIFSSLLIGKYMLIGFVSLVIPAIIALAYVEFGYWKPNIWIYENGIFKIHKGRVTVNEKGRKLKMRVGFMSSKEMPIENNEITTRKGSIFLFIRDEQGFVVPMNIEKGEVTYHRDPKVEKILRNMLATTLNNFSTRYKPQNKWVLISAVSIAIVLFGLGIFAAMVLQSFSDMYKKNSEQALQLSQSIQLMQKQMNIQEKTLNATLRLLNTTIETEKNLGLVGVAQPSTPINQTG